jgi:hypothetical protein
MQNVQVEYSGQIQVNAGKNPRELYAHQNEAIKALDQKNKVRIQVNRVERRSADNFCIPTEDERHSGA